MTRRTLAIVVVALAAALFGGAGEARAADECRGLQVCLPVPGPWVAIPAATGGGAPSVSWEMRCPLRNYIVAGIDARVSDRAIDVSIRGENGAPVSPGVTTGRSVLFTAVYTGSSRRPTAFRPFIGCVPTSGGGGRGETAVRRMTAFAPGKPLDRRVVERRLVSGASVRATGRCPAGTRLLGSQHAFAFRILGVQQQADGEAVIGHGVDGVGDQRDRLGIEVLDHGPQAVHDQRGLLLGRTQHDDLLADHVAACFLGVIRNPHAVGTHVSYQGD